MILVIIKSQFILRWNVSFGICIPFHAQIFPLVQCFSFPRTSYLFPRETHGVALLHSEFNRIKLHTIEKKISYENKQDNLIHDMPINFPGFLLASPLMHHQTTMHSKYIWCISMSYLRFGYVCCNEFDSRIFWVKFLVK